MKLYKSAHYIGSKDNFLNSQLWSSLLAEFLLAIMHPNVFFHCI